MADHYHSALLGPTYPNRMYLYSGTSFGLTTNDFPSLTNYPTPETPVIIFDELAHALQLARPECGAEEARLRAGAAYSLVNEVVMHPRLWRLEGMASALTTLAQTALGPLPR